jgi:hypothetical protein
MVGHNARELTWLWLEELTSADKLSTIACHCRQLRARHRSLGGLLGVCRTFRQMLQTGMCHQGHPIQNGGMQKNGCQMISMVSQWFGFQWYSLYPKECWHSNELRGLKIQIVWWVWWVALVNPASLWWAAAVLQWGSKLSDIMVSSPIVNSDHLPRVCIVFFRWRWYLIMKTISIDDEHDDSGKYRFPLGVEC